MKNLWQHSLGWTDQRSKVIDLKEHLNHFEQFWNFLCQLQHNHSSHSYDKWAITGSYTVNNNNQCLTLLIFSARGRERARPPLGGLEVLPTAAASSFSSRWYNVITGGVGGSWTGSKLRHQHVIGGRATAWAGGSVRECRLTRVSVSKRNCRGGPTNRSGGGQHWTGGPQWLKCGA